MGWDGMGYSAVTGVAIALRQNLYHCLIGLPSIHPPIWVGKTMSSLLLQNKIILLGADTQRAFPNDRYIILDMVDMDLRVNFSFLDK